MKTKERLERAGWIYLLTFGLGIELLGRENILIFFDPKTDEAISFYIVNRKSIPDITKIDECQLEVFCEKL